MWVTMALGLLQMYFPLGMFERPEPRRVRPPNFARNMLIVGGLRLAALNKSCILNCAEKKDGNWSTWATYSLQIF